MPRNRVVGGCAVGGENMEAVDGSVEKIADDGLVGPVVPDIRGARASW